MYFWSVVLVFGLLVFGLSCNTLNFIDPPLLIWYRVKYMEKNFNKLNIVFITLLALVFFGAGALVGQIVVFTRGGEIISQELPRGMGEKDGACVVRKLPDYVDKGAVDFDHFFEIWQTIENRYYKQPVPDQALFNGALKGMAASLGDPYTVFLDKEEAEAFTRELEGKFEGIGAEIGIKHDVLTIIAPLEGSPAKRAGLRPQDIIFKIDGVDTLSMTVEEAVQRIRGEKGTSVVLTILHKGGDAPQDITIVRDEIVVKTVTWKLVGQSSQVAYIRLSSFNEDTADELRQIIVPKVKKAKPKGIILDLRSNPGGFLDVAVKVASFWIKEGAIVQERFSNQPGENYMADGTGELGSIPTVVLVNEGSASASEIVAGSLKDYDKATIVGEKTFGKGSVQDYSTFRDGSALKITVAEWLTPKGTSINEEGITPDIIVEFKPEDFNEDKDPQMDKAIELLN